MKTNEAVLEYCVDENSPNAGGSWKFRFKDSSGRVLIDSPGYPTLDQAEKGFLSLVKSIATNQYSVLTPEQP